MTVANRGEKYTRHAPTAMCILVAAGAIGMEGARLCGYRFLVMPIVLLASTSFVALALSCGALRSVAGRLTLCGLVCCWFGDVSGPGNFLLGLGAFLIGHFFFAASFVRHGVAPQRVLAAVAAVLAVSGATVGMLWSHVRAGERPQFAAYCTVISIMLIAAGGARPGLPLALPAAVLFYVSDVCVARWRYLDSTVDGYVCYVLYYAACAMFALNTRYLLKAQART